MPFLDKTKYSTSKLSNTEQQSVLRLIDIIKRLFHSRAMLYTPSENQNIPGRVIIRKDCYGELDPTQAFGSNYTPYEGQIYFHIQDND